MSKSTLPTSMKVTIFCLCITIAAQGVTIIKQSNALSQSEEMLIKQSDLIAAQMDSMAVSSAMIADLMMNCEEPATLPPARTLSEVWIASVPESPFDAAYVADASLSASSIQTDIGFDSFTSILVDTNSVATCCTDIDTGLTDESLDEATSLAPVGLAVWCLLTAALFVIRARRQR